MHIHNVYFWLKDGLDDEALASFEQCLDALAHDPLADMRLMPVDYARMGYRLVQMAPAGRTILFLEGGYHLEAMEAATAATLRGMAGEFPDLGQIESPTRSWQVLDVAAAQAAAAWDV